jgi:PKD repeat protein/glucose/arabinose dehydrogenase
MRGQANDVVPPTVTSRSPAPNATGVATVIDIRATFSEPVQTGSVAMELRNSVSQLIPSHVSYEPATRTATLNPTAELAGSQTFTVTVSGARDLAGNQMTPVSWSFTTATAGFQDVVLAPTGLLDPTVLQFAADGRLFVAEKGGRIWTYDDLADPMPTLVADLRVSVYNFWDRGLLGMALHPNFPHTPYIYVLYTRDAVPGGTAPRWGSASLTGNLSDTCPSPPGATESGCVVSGRLARLNAGNPASWPLNHTHEEPLVSEWFQQFPSHSVGTLAFGPDGALYASAGEGAAFTFADTGQIAATPPANDPPDEGGAFRSQDILTSGDPVTLDGSIIRIDPDTGFALADNPRFLTDSDPNGMRLIAHGLRNPFRFALRPGTREMWIGDVGWGEWEEINRIVDTLDSEVENFGWPCFEGNGTQRGAYRFTQFCQNLYAQGSNAVVSPYLTYSHDTQVVAGEACPSGSAAISGLAFYSAEGGTYPPSYNGALFFSDYPRNCIWAMRTGANGLPDPGNLVTIRSGAAGPVHVVPGPGGDIFYVGHDDDRLHRIRYIDGNLPPSAAIAANPQSGASPLTVSFSGTQSSDPEGQPLGYAWDLDGDGAFDDSTASSPQWLYTGTGTVTVRLRVSDPAGLSDVAALDISYGNTAPTAIIESPTGSLTWRVGDRIAFSGRGSDPDETSGLLPPSSLSWQLVIHHCPSNCHTHAIETFQGVASGSFVAPDHEYPSHLELRLTATDPGGLQSSSSVWLQPQTVALTFDTSPSGLQLTLNAATHVTPFAQTVIVGSANTVGAPTPQTLGTLHQFTAWSHGAPQTHLLLAPGSATRYVATFTTGALSGFVSAPTASQNLSTLGSIDWAHWGHSPSGWYTHKAGVSPQISITVIGSSAPSRYASHPIGFSWNSGTPTSTATNSSTGVYVSGVGNGFRITAPADPTPRTLILFVGVWAAQGRLAARLSDGSAPDYVDTSMAHATGIVLGKYQLSYRSASPGQTLTVSYTQSDPGAGVVAIQAAALTAGLASPTRAPSNLRATVAGNKVTLIWEAPTLTSTPSDYIVEAGSAPGLRDILVAPTGSVATTVSATAPNGTYHARVRAVTPDGATEPSNEVVVRVGCVEVPAAPSGLSFELVGANVTLRWEPSLGAIGYYVQVGSASGLSDLVIARMTGSPVATQAPPGTYFVRVVAHNACGVSQPSNEVVVHVGTAQ